jgi:predicted RNA methylase
MLNKSFYPTPPLLAVKIVNKIKGNPRKILEPSAGKGDLVSALTSRYQHQRAEISCIEIDPVLQATLRGLKHKVIDTDFLAYEGQDKFDAIIANPPFDAGDLHLLKAIEIMYRGEIVFLLNAETLRNPHTNTRKLLAQKLNEHGAEIEYIQNAFVVAERKTPVEVALVYIKIDRATRAAAENQTELF